VHDYRQLRVWKRARRLTLRVCETTDSFPGHERHGLVSQMRRAAVSIGANLAEGSGAGSNPNFARFVQHAIGSSLELEYELGLAHHLGYLASAEPADLSDELAQIRGMWMGLRDQLRRP